MAKVDKRRGAAADPTVARDARSRYEISQAFIDEVRDSTLPDDIVRLLERRAERSRRSRLTARPKAA
jgi:hypothetical protein